MREFCHRTVSLHLCSCPLSRGGHVFLLLPALLSDQAEAIGEMHWRGEGSSFLFFCLLCQKVAGISHTNRRNLWHSISMYWHVYLFPSDLRMHASSFSIVLVNCLSVKILKKEIDSHTLKVGWFLACEGSFSSGNSQFPKAVCPA